MQPNPIDEVVLREVADADLPVFFEHQRDAQAARMAAFAPRERTAFMTHWSVILNDVRIAKRTILFDGQVAGNVVSFDRGGEREVGYWIGREYWGKGIATLALAAFLSEITERPLHARVAKHNFASIRVLQKCGFTIAGESSAPSQAGGEEIEEFVMRLA